MIFTARERQERATAEMWERKDRRDALKRFEPCNERRNLKLKTKCKKCGIEFEIPDPDSGIMESQLAGVVAGLAVNLICDTCEIAGLEEEQKRQYTESENIYIRRSRLIPDFLKWDSGKGNNKMLAWINANAGQSLYLADTYGTCKTRAVTVGAWKSFALHPQMKFYRMTDLMNEIMELYGQSMHDMNEFKDRLCALDLLIIDDFGKEKLTDRAGEVVYDIIDSFYIQNRRKIWITTNTTDQERLIEHLGVDRGYAIVRRIMEKCKQWQEVSNALS